MIIKDEPELTEPLTEDEVEPIGSDLCQHCDPIYQTVCINDEGKKREWACVGMITQPEDPMNVHDALNTVRICIERGEDKITSHEWTPYEAHTIALMLQMAVNTHLEDGQPTVEHVAELVKLGYTQEHERDE